MCHAYKYYFTYFNRTPKVCQSLRCHFQAVLQQCLIFNANIFIIPKLNNHKQKNSVNLRLFDFDDLCRVVVFFNTLYELISPANHPINFPIRPTSLYSHFPKKSRKKPKKHKKTMSQHVVACPRVVRGQGSTKNRIFRVYSRLFAV